MSRLIAISMIITAIVGSIVLAVYYWPLLPVKVAEHFDAGGNADRWTSKGVLVATHIGLQLGTAAFFGLIAWSISFVPESMMNIPNKEYWLAAERKAETVEFSKVLLLVVGAATCFFMLFLSLLVYRASLQDGQMWAFGFWGLMGVYLAFVFGLVGYNFWRFRLPQSVS